MIMMVMIMTVVSGVDSRDAIILIAKLWLVRVREPWQRKSSSEGKLIWS